MKKLIPLLFGRGEYPAALSGIFGDFLALLGGERISAGTAALEAALAANADVGLIFVLVCGGYRRAVGALAGENIACQLAELYGIAGAFKALVCHRSSMPIRPLQA